MKKLISIVCAVTIVLTLGACGNGGAGSQNSGSTTAAQSTDSSGSTTAAPPATHEKIEDMKTAADWDALKTETHTLTLDMIKGYFSDEVWRDLIDGFKADHPNWTIEEKMTDKLDPTTVQARLLGGDIPTFAEFKTPDLPLTTLYSSGQLLPLAQLLDAPSYDSAGKTIRQTLPSGIDTYKYQGIEYGVPYRYGANGFWYNVQMFEDHGWQEPKTWDDLLKLCQNIKNAGITPIMFTGTFAPYPFTMLVGPRMASLGGGRQFMLDMCNLADGSWSGAVNKQAIEDLVSMRDKGYFTNEVLGTDYLLAQQMFFEGKSAMVLSGTWLEGEMKDSIPEGFRFNFMVPPVKQNSSDPGMLLATTMAWMLYNGSSQEVAGMEFIRYIVSAKFEKNYAEKQGVPTVTNVDISFDTDKMSPAALSIIKAATAPDTVMIPGPSAYGDLYNNFCNGVIGVLAGNETVANLLTKTEAAMQEVKKDDSMAKVEVY